MMAAELKKSADELTIKLQQIDAEHQACTETGGGNGMSIKGSFLNS